MAKYYSSTFGKISGKHGTAVAVIMKDGSTYLRKYTKPSNPRTDKQQAHRAKFALSSKALVPFNPIFKETMGITNGISIARSYAFKNAIVDKYPSFSVDYSKLMLSFGSIEKLQSPTIARIEKDVVLKWEFQKMYNCHQNDRVNIVVFNKGMNQSTHLKDVALRSDKECKIDIHESWLDSDLYLWAYVTCKDNISDSVFIANSDVTDIHDCAKDEFIDNKSIDTSVYSGINNAIMSLIVMLYNLFDLFKQMVIETNIQIPTNSLTYKHYSILKVIDNTYKEATLSLNLMRTRRSVFKILRCVQNKYHNMFTPKLIPIISTNHKLAIRMH